jgi:hypothetical protein
MEVVEHEHERLRFGELLEECADRAVAAIPLVLARDLASALERGQGGKDVGEFRLHIGVERGELAMAETLDVFVERIHEDGKRQLTLELGRRSGKDEVAAQLGASAQLGKQARLADARLARKLDRTRAAVIKLIEELLKRRQLLGATHEAVALARLSRIQASRHAASFGRLDAPTNGAAAESVENTDGESAR